MIGLSISFERVAELDRVSARLTRVADVHGVPTDGPASDVRVKAGRAKTIEVEPGLYLVEACWRDGSVTTQRCLVEASGITDFVLNAPKRPRRTQLASRDFSQPSAGGMFRGAARTSNGGDAYVVFTSGDPGATWNLLHDRDDIERRAQLHPDGRPVARPGDLEVHVADRSSRNWMVYWACDHWSVSSLPQAGPEEDTTVLRSDPDGMPFVSVADPDMGTMADMLTVGDAEAARRYSAGTYADLAENDLQDLDRMISERPLEVCAFAYADRENFSAASWSSALERVADRHLALSDVCIILGWRTLMTARDHRDWATAGDLFERAVEAGVPYYSVGVRLLAEGLSMLAEEAPRHKESARLVRSIAARTVRSEAFTTISL